LLAVPPVRGAGCAATGTENAFIQTIEFLAVVTTLAVFSTIFWLRVSLEIWLYRLVLLVEVSQIRYQILHDICVWQWVDPRLLRCVCRNSAQTSQCIDPVDIHRTAPTNTLSAASSEGQGRVNLILYPNQRVQNHRACFVQIESVCLHPRLRRWLIWIPSVDMKGLDFGVFAGSGLFNSLCLFGRDKITGRCGWRSRLADCCICSDSWSEERARWCRETGC